MRVELLFWEGCPSHEKALAELRAALADVELDPGEVVVREVETQEQAAAEHFVGSPTVRIELAGPGKEYSATVVGKAKYQGEIPRAPSWHRRGN